MAKSREYWKKRLENIADVQNKKADTYIESLELQYKKAMASIQKDLESFYIRYGNAEGVDMFTAKRLLSNAEKEMWEVSLEEYRKMALDEEFIEQIESMYSKSRVSRLKALEMQIRAQLEALYSGLNDGLETLLIDTFADTYYQTIYEIQKGTGIGTNFAMFNEDAVKKIISKPWKWGHFSSTVWNNKDLLLDELETALSQAFIRGDSIDKVIKTFDKRMGVGYSRAANVIQTEHAYIAGEAAFKGYEDTGVEKYEYLATLDTRTSAICRGMDGKTFKLSEKVVWLNYPPLHCRCRSTTVPYFEDEEAYGKRIARDREGKVYYVPEDMKYHDWYNKYVKDGRQDTDSRVIEKRQKGNISVNDSQKKVDVSIYTPQESKTDWTKYLDIEKETSEQLNLIHSNLNKEMIETNTEKLVLLDINTNSILTQKTGDVDNVEFDKSIINLLKKSPSDSIILTHNHPSNTPFSEADIQNIITYKSIKALTLECIDGSQYIMERSELKSGAVKGYFFGDKYMSIYREIGLKYPELNDSIKIYEIWSTYIDHVNKEVARKYGMLYRKVDK